MTISPSRRRRAAALLALLLAGFAGTLAAQDLTLPGGATLARELVEQAGGHAVPTGPWKDGVLPTQDAVGRVTRQAWRVPGAPVTTLQLTNTLEAQLEAAGYSTVYRCASAVCGGFDFRFALTVLPPPEMFVDLFDYHYISARKPVDGTDTDAFVTLLISQSGADTYIQITRIAPASAAASMTGAPVAAPPGVVPASPAPLMQSLTQRGHAVLRDLDFATGADRLGPGPFASLTALAAFLKADGTRRIALVGHTDTVGGLEPNLALSRRRAQAVMQRLIDAYGVAPTQMEADGIAYLSPTAPNTNEAGREANRRVEAVLLSGG